MHTLRHPLLLSLFSLALSAPLQADNRVERHHSFPVEDLEELRISGKVGNLELELGNDDEIEVELVIEGQNRGWFRRDKQVDDVDLVSRHVGRRLILEQTGKNTETTWRIRAPALPETDISFGVGEVRVEQGDGDLEVDLGVGEVRIEAQSRFIDEVKVRVGVGDVHIDRGLRTREEGAFLSREVHAYGDGQRDIHVNVGVGDVKLRLD